MHMTDHNNKQIDISFNNNNNNNNVYLRFHYITKTCLFKYTENFTSLKWKFSDKNSDFFFFHISAQNIYCVYSLEPPRRGGSNEYPQSVFEQK